jgi:UDPglucose 6-dehydrogenase
MKIGIAGLGIVGSACKFGFEKLGHEVSFYDKKFKQGQKGCDIKELINTEIIFICVPTPRGNDGSCDISIVEEIIAKLKNINYKNIICIKSTVSPGTTKKLKEKYSLELCFVPEFLRERCAITDFTENHDLCVIGTDAASAYEKIKQAHGKLPKKFVQLTSDEAEMVKYFNNSFNAARIVFANSFYEICKNKNINYTNVKNAAVNIHHIPDYYLDCNENFRGFAGMCLPKDVSELAVLEKQTRSNFFKDLLEENDKYIKTVFEGMRKE